MRETLVKRPLASAIEALIISPSSLKHMYEYAKNAIYKSHVLVVMPCLIWIGSL